MDFHPELLERYGGNVPRYTSYPTALQFHDRISASDYMTAVADGSQKNMPVSIYVHVPFCGSPCYYCACNRVITRQAETGTEYAARLMQEVALRGRCFDGDRPALQLHFGGGTPTFLSTEILGEVIGAIGRHFPLTDDARRDYSIEIDPRTLTSSTLLELRHLGFNRLSLGVQDFDPKVQHYINRVQPEEMVQEALSAARRLNYSSVNFDLIYGLPGQSIPTFGRTLERVIAMRPDRIAMYGYAHMPELFKAQKKFARLALPDAKARIALLSLGIEALSSAGYVHIGMDHFALPDDSLAKARAEGTLHRSFQGYTTHGQSDLVNLGATAIGRVGDLFVQNVKGLHPYKLAIDCGELPLWRGMRLTPEDQLRGEIIQQIMCHRHIAIGMLEAKWNLSFTSHFAAELSALRCLQDDELLTMEADEINVTSRGEYLLRNIAVVFDAYAQRGGGLLRASKAI